MRVQQAASTLREKTLESRLTHSLSSSLPGLSSFAPFLSRDKKRKRKSGGFGGILDDQRRRDRRTRGRLASQRLCKRGKGEGEVEGSFPRFLEDGKTQAETERVASSEIKIEIDAF